LVGHHSQNNPSNQTKLLFGRVAVSLMRATPKHHAELSPGGGGGGWDVGAEGRDVATEASLPETVEEPDAVDDLDAFTEPDAVPLPDIGFGIYAPEAWIAAKG
jgi:hypothetical protein